MTTCEWRRAYSHTQLVEYKMGARAGNLSLLIPPTYLSYIIMANYDANYNPSADPAFDEAPFTGEENAVDVVDADTSAAKITAQEDRDAERTDSHGQPSKCTRTSMSYSDGT